MATVLTWELLDARPNRAGDAILLRIKATGTGSQLSVRPSVEESVGRTTKVGPIRKWRSASDTRLREQTNTDKATADAHVTNVFAFDMSDVETDGTDFWVTFKVSIELAVGWRIPIHPDGGAPRILRLQNTGGNGNSWFTLHIPNSPTPLDDDAPQWDDIDLDMADFGRAPDLSGDLRLGLNSQAEWIKKDGVEPSPPWTWHDYSGDGVNMASVDDPELKGNPGASLFRPTVVFDGGATDTADAVSNASPPAIGEEATIAAVFVPNSPTGKSTIVGRFNAAGPSWRLAFDAAAADTIVYESKPSGGGGVVSMAVATDQETVFALIRRTPDGVGRFWINGVPAEPGTVSTTVAAGSGPLSAGAGMTGSLTWGDGFKGQINQVALYDADIDDLPLSLLMFQSARWAGIDLGTPIPEAWQTQPYGDANPEPNRRLSRRPIAVINLFRGDYDRNPFGQSIDWRKDDGTADIESLKNAIREAVNGCDQFEIMFNRPGGQYRGDVVMSYVFGDADAPSPGTPVITSDQWSAMATLWTFFNLDDHDDDNDRNANNYRKRRGWFDVGGGLPIEDGTGALDQTGHMGSRQVAPATPTVYYDNILTHWAGRDGRYRCLMMDAAAVVFGKFVELVHDELVAEDFTLIGEAIPTEIEARKGAVWFAMPRLIGGPWWKLDGAGVPNKNLGYNFNWTNDWTTQPIYFGVQSGLTQNITGGNLIPADDEGNEGNDLPIGVIFALTLKGASPAAWYSGTYQKVGAAWNYATGRVAPSRQIRCPRLLRSARV